MYDAELAQFTRDYPNTSFTRTITIEQRVIVNSHGGVAIQSVPHFSISYHHGYEPIPTMRELSAVCTSNDDLKRFEQLLQFVADPTPDHQIRKARNFTDAFAALHRLSPLRYGNLEDAGIPLAGLYDVVILTGTSAHEVFGHHFEELVQFLEFGDSSTFKHNQDIGNSKLLLRDDPHQEVAGFRVMGFTYFDAYGRTREARTHIQNGFCREFLGSEYVDSEKLHQYMNIRESTFVGNASQHIDGQFPQARMSCTVLDGETHNIDLEGKILLVSHEGTTQPNTKTYSVSARECYVIQNGVPRRIVPLKVTGGINQALSQVVLLPDWTYNTGYCSKPEPVYYPHSRGVGQIPVSQFSRVQLWKQQQVYPHPISEEHLCILLQ